MPLYPADARADLIGPTVNSNLEQAVPLTREEPFQLKAQKALPISIATKDRPLTSRVDHQLRAAPAVVLNRSSNQNPSNLGQDEVTSIWGISDPFAAQNALGEASAPKQWIKPVLVGSAIALMGCLILKGRKRA